VSSSRESGANKFIIFIGEVFLQESFKTDQEWSAYQEERRQLLRRVCDDKRDVIFLVNNYVECHSIVSWTIQVSGNPSIVNLQDFRQGQKLTFALLEEHSRLRKITIDTALVVSTQEKYFTLFASDDRLRFVLLNKDREASLNSWPYAVINKLSDIWNLTEPPIVPAEKLQQLVP
jgi:hypothetical protein